VNPSKLTAIDSPSATHRWWAVKTLPNPKFSISFDKDYFEAMVFNSSAASVPLREDFLF